MEGGGRIKFRLVLPRIKKQQEEGLFMKKILTVLGLVCSLPVLAQSAAEPTISAKDQQEFVNLLKSRGITDAKQGQALARETLRREKLIGQEAWKQRLERDPLVKRQLAESRSKIYGDALVRNYLSKHPVTEAEIERQYQAEKARYNPTEVKLRHILVQDEKQAKDLIYLISVGEDMGKIAREKSLDKATVKDSGELPFTNVKGFAVPELGSVSMLLKRGELYRKPIKSQYGYHIIRLEDKRTVPFPPLESMKDKLRTAAAQIKAAQYMNGLLAPKHPPIQSTIRSKTTNVKKPNAKTTN